MLRYLSEEVGKATENNLFWFQKRVHMNQQLLAVVLFYRFSFQISMGLRREELTADREPRYLLWLIENTFLSRCYKDTGGWGRHYRCLGPRVNVDTPEQDALITNLKNRWNTEDESHQWLWWDKGVFYNLFNNDHGLLKKALNYSYMFVLLAIILEMSLKYY